MCRLRSGLGLRGRWQWEIVVIHVHGDEVGRVWFCRAYIATMRGGDEDRAMGVSSLANEEPLVVVEACVDVVWEVVGENCGDSRGSVVGKGETPLCRGGCRSVHERTLGAQNRDIGCGWGSSVHRGSEVFAMGRGDKDVIGIDGDVFVKRGEEESVEDFLGYLGRSGRHC